MAAPELYLSLLSGQYGDALTEDDVGSHPSTRPFPKDDLLMDLLDALAAICIQNEKGEVFVSLAMDSNATTLYVSSNETVPTTVVSHLRKIWDQLKQLQPVVEFDPSIPADSESSLDPNGTQSRTDGELELQKTIYEYSYKKLRRRVLKRVPTILAQYQAIMTSLETNAEDTHLLVVTRDPQ